MRTLAHCSYPHHTLQWSAEEALVSPISLLPNLQSIEQTTTPLLLQSKEYTKEHRTQSLSSAGTRASSAAPAHTILLSKAASQVARKAGAAKNSNVRGHNRTDQVWHSSPSAPILSYSAEP